MGFHQNLYPQGAAWSKGEFTLKNQIFYLLLFLSVNILTGCSKPQTCEVSTLDIEALLITIEDMPTPLSWSTSGPGNVFLDRERTSDTIYIAFVSDIYPYLGTDQEVFRYQTIKDAERDFKYASEYFGNGYFPDGWTFTSEVVDESHFSCRDGVSVDFPMCYWIARYDCIVIECRSWLITERMTLEDMENIVRKIDKKSSELIPDCY